ncbi:MAG: AAA family ATPase [Candidatus Aenigmatarchaeota archaeon]
MNTAITKLTMQGFKSFNRRVSIPFLPGFNCIAGPNGSGKSNILDAIAFVLGRTSAKSLRADRLHELIFHGGNGKKPADFASVTLTFDNSKKVFPVEGDELSIVRKVNRKGVTVYKMNDRTVTRDKILQTLNAARIHPDGHNIILQGDITEIIEMNPVERRQIIDEISGIAEYNDKKEKAQRDLDAVDQKLKEAEIIITQRYDIFKKLEEERNAAIKYQNLQQQLRVLKASFINKKMQILQDQLTKIEEALAEKKELNEKLSKELEEVETELDIKEASIREVADKLIALSKRVELEKEISELRSQLLIKKDKIDANIREIERLNNLIERLEALESKKAELTGEIPRAVQSIIKLNLRGVFGTVANLISVPEKYQVAVEVAAGPHLYDIVVENDDVASYCIEYLRRERIGRATFLPLNKIRPILFGDLSLLNKPGVIGIASKLIKYDTKFMSAIEFVFGNTLIVENLDAARAVGIGKARMVTLDGDLIERSGAMVGGYYVKSHPKFVEASVKQEIDRYIDLRNRLRDEVETLKEDVNELERKLKKVGVSEEAKEFIDLEKLRIASEQEVDKLRERRRKLHERKLNLEIEINTRNIEKARIETELQNAKFELEQYGEMTYVDEKLHTLEEFIKKIERELASIGLVNLKAIDEFEKFKVEFEGYKEKYEKILEEKKAVLQMIQEIEEKRKEVFFKTLNEISKEFNNIFVKMTKGTASLELEDPNNIESGLIIKASPKGKTLLNIDAMSGGEKSLTALAFIFAIQKYKPAPFYILDEVDAALDKENSKIVAEMIKEFSKNAQFILITHNDTTIKYGDRVYGVSMVDGESKIMALELPKV